MSNCLTCNVKNRNYVKLLRLGFSEPKNGARKKLKAEKEKEEADANNWWEENSKRFLNMKVKDCHDFLKQISVNQDVRPKVYGIMFARLRQWKGDPPPPRPRSPPCSEYCSEKDGILTHSTYCKKWKEQDCITSLCTKTRCFRTCPKYRGADMHWTEMQSVN